MYVDGSNQKTYGDMTSFCKTKWNGQGGLPHFFSEIEFERLKFYISNSIGSPSYVLPLNGGGFSSAYRYLLSDDKTKIFNYLPWYGSDPGGFEDRVYILGNNLIVDASFGDTVIVCQSKNKNIIPFTFN